MTMYFYRLIIFIILFSSCAAGNRTVDKKKYRHSKTLVTYSGMANEFEDGYLQLKENGYFKYYQRIWLLGNLKEGAYIGRYTQSNDTIYLNWLNADPKKIKNYLSSIAVKDTTVKSVSFIDEVSGERLWSIGLR